VGGGYVQIWGSSSTIKYGLFVAEVHINDSKYTHFINSFSNLKVPNNIVATSSYTTCVPQYHSYRQLHNTRVQQYHSYAQLQTHVSHNTIATGSYNTRVPQYHSYRQLHNTCPTIPQLQATTQHKRATLKDG